MPWKTIEVGLWRTYTCKKQKPAFVRNPRYLMDFDKKARVQIWVEGKKQGGRHA